MSVSFRSYSDARFAPAVAGSIDLLRRLGAGEGPAMDQLTPPGAGLSRIERALNLMFAAHGEQLRPDGAPYVNHTLLVARVAAFKFGITDPSAIVAALLHDAPEDQAKRILELLTGENSKSSSDAIRAISRAFEAAPGKVAQYLHALTNPDFGACLHAVRNAPSSEQGMYGAKLIQMALQARGLKHIPLLELDDARLKNLMYLGHWVELSHGDRTAFAIKLADFYGNGLHFHLFKNDGNPPSAAHAKKAAKLQAKYSPVVTFLSALFDAANTKGHAVISPRADRLLREKLSFAMKHGFESDSPGV